MARTTESLPAADSSAIVIVLDSERMRAQQINCMLMANTMFQKNNPGLSSALVFGRITDTSVLFTMFSNARDARVYLFTMLNPDGSQCHLSHLDSEGAPQELDEFDQGFISTISASLASTLVAAYQDMVPTPVQPTHPGVSLLQ